MKIIVERLPRIFLLTLVILLATIVAVQDSFLTRVLKETRQNIADSGNVVNDCREQLDACKDTSNTLEDVIVSDNLIHYVGEINGYNVSFEYPSEYSVVEEFPNSRKQVVIYHDLKDDGKEKFSKLVVISHRIDKLSYDPEMEEKETKDDRKGIINGKTRNFDYFIIGDGDAGGFHNEGNYVAMVEKDLWVSVNFQSSAEYIQCIEPNQSCILLDKSKCVTKSVCDSDETYGMYNEFKTSQSDIERGFKILESMKWEKIQRT
jgi:hypothetical protein